MSSHKYKIGQTVRYSSYDRASGACTVLQLLPPEGNQFQYRIRNVNEPHERVVKEHELGRLGGLSATRRKGETRVLGAPMSTRAPDFKKEQKGSGAGRT